MKGEQEMIGVQKCVAHPWMCDVLGHLTTRFYVGMFDDASYRLLHTVFGWTGASDDAGKTAWVDARHLIEYRAEVTAGDLLEMMLVFAVATIIVIRAFLALTGYPRLGGGGQHGLHYTGSAAASPVATFGLSVVSALDAREYPGLFCASHSDIPRGRA